jgi:hypothetical protein
MPRVNRAEDDDSLQRLRMLRTLHESRFFFSSNDRTAVAALAQVRGEPRTDSAVARDNQPLHWLISSGCTRQVGVACARKTVWPAAPLCFESAEV